MGWTTQILDNSRAPAIAEGAGRGRIESALSVTGPAWVPQFGYSDPL